MDATQWKWLSGAPLALVALMLGCAAPSVPKSLGQLPAPAAEQASRATTAIQQTAHVVAIPQSEELPVRLPPVNVPECKSNSYPINLPTALQLADAENLQVAFAREQLRQSYARVDRASALWLPSLRGGVNYYRHEGAIQDVAGRQFDTSRGAFYTGLGAGGFGASSPVIPGLYMNFALADAIFQPLAARQFAGSRERLAAAARNDALLRVSLAYLELLKATEETAIARSTEQLTDALAKLTGDYALSGEGLPSDADRLQAEAAVRRNDVARSEENARVASARLAQLLRLDPLMALLPLEPAVVPIDLQDTRIPLPELVSQGLTNRPELAANRFLVGEAVQRLRREECAPLIPSLLVGTSYGGMSAGIGSNFRGIQDRFDADAIAYWELRNLGLGDRAARADARSLMEQARLRQLESLDLVAREVVEAHAQVEARRRQIDVARDGVVAAENSYQRNYERIRGAKGLPIEALQALQALSQARREYLRALIDYNAAQFALHRALGCPVALGSNGTTVESIPRGASSN